MPQTFLMDPDFEKSAKFLDNQRLGKQRSEAWGILNALVLLHEDTFWSKTHVAKTWRGHEYWLAKYGIAICKEWVSRGYRDEQLPKFEATLRILIEKPRPWFVDDQRFLGSHRANLLRKNPEHYGQFGWAEEPSDVYFWPHLESPCEAE